MLKSSAAELFDPRGTRLDPVATAPGSVQGALPNRGATAPSAVFRILRGWLKESMRAGMPALQATPSLTVGLLPHLLTAYCLLFFRSRHAGPALALSTFYRGHRRYGFLFVSGDDHQVSLLNRA
jgi:hypothetical protein